MHVPDTVQCTNICTQFPIVFSKCFIPETAAESEEDTQEKLRQIFVFINLSVLLHSTKSLFLNN